MPLSVRAATLADLAAIHAIEQAAPGAANWSVAQYEKLIDTGVVLVAEHSGHLRGFVCARQVAGEWELENIAVDPGFLRRGVADLLMLALLELARGAGIASIHLEVRESNRPARRLYQKHRFREVARRRSYYQNPSEDAILYTFQAV